MTITSGPGNNLLRVQVYNYLQEQMRQGTLSPGSSIRVNTLIAELGISRTPLREALLLLQEQGFVTIQPQRGVKINLLTMDDVADIYEILSGIESRILLSVFPQLTQEHLATMISLNQEIEASMEAGDMVRHNQANIAFHNVFLQLSTNQRMRRYVEILKAQLYDFPRRDYGSRWNQRNLDQHSRLVELIRENRAREAADYLRDIHWAFDPPDAFTIIANDQ
ncbi:GntR family transcriptional regulator [Desulfogranum mediterraneum]|uniref:GntR family transcriptional regulator n=1 Tax=Desulfogranum mediterraneum TaxID=160661 RepID=UPI0004186699|nr:GntR family transcriptional regulator [Desulfogranum mediterraneum]